MMDNLVAEELERQKLLHLAGVDHPDVIMTVKEMALYLKLARSTVYRLVKEDRLPGKKVGGRWRFSQRRLDEWMRGRGEIFLDGRHVSA